MVLTMRFEYYENVVNKHHLNKVDWRQAAQWAFMNNLNKSGWTVADVQQVDDNTVQIIKRRDQKRSFFYNLGFDQRGLYERVTINRADNSVAVDRIDGNWWHEQPFLGQRDLFYLTNSDREAIMNGTAKNPRLTFVQHNFWQHKIHKLETNLWSNWNAWSYRRAFRGQQI